MGELLNVPLAQAEQVRSTVADGVLLTNVPALHVVHAGHVAALVVVLKVPDAQPVHTRSAAAVPAVATFWPATHVV